MEVPLLNRRLSSPRAATAIALAAVVAAAIVVTPSFAGSLLTPQKAAHVYLKKQAAANLYVKKATAPLTPVASIAASNAVFGPVSTTTAGYIPTAFTSFATKGTGPAVITFSGQATCTATTAGEACPVSILVDDYLVAKVNFATSTTGTPAAAAEVHTVTVSDVLSKGGHTVAIEYAGAPKVTFTLKSWNLAVQAYPQNSASSGSSKGSGK
jgi:hypothetical protein